jgi:hypothetical protein
VVVGVHAVNLNLAKLISKSISTFSTMEYAVAGRCAVVDEFR